MVVFVFVCLEVDYEFLGLDLYSSTNDKLTNNAYVKIT